VPIVLREVRINKKMSLRALSRKSGVSVSQISRIERGESDPTFSVMCSLSYALKVPYYEIFLCSCPSDAANS